MVCPEAQPSDYCASTVSYRRIEPVDSGDIILWNEYVSFLGFLVGNSFPYHDILLNKIGCVASMDFGNLFRTVRKSVSEVFSQTEDKYQFHDYKGSA